MGNQRDFYETLGLKRNAGEKEIKSAYRKLVKKYHPDANPDDANAEEKIKEINDAYAVLSDPQKKAEYDQFGHSGSERGEGKKSDSPFSGGYSGGDINIDDLFTGAYGDYVRRGRKKGEQGRGRDITVNINVSWDEAISGTDKKIAFNYSEKCDACNETGSRTGGAAAGVCKQCNGAGFERVVSGSAFGKVTRTRECQACKGSGKDMGDSCLKCSGKGYIKISKKIVVKVPRNTVNGQIITIRGLGELGNVNSERGDLIVKVSVRPKYGF
ncbi:MAG: DnaJ domain-containing protein [Oscillospiraceae bacterium]|nr:DnaJ domain-containing protein [Oscillospiraceae bacterium]